MMDRHQHQENKSSSQSAPCTPTADVIIKQSRGPASILAERLRQQSSRPLPASRNVLSSSSSSLKRSTSENSCCGGVVVADNNKNDKDGTRCMPKFANHRAEHETTATATKINYLRVSCDLPFIYQYNVTFGPSNNVESCHRVSIMTRQPVVSDVVGLASFYDDATSQLFSPVNLMLSDVTIQAKHPISSSSSNVVNVRIVFAKKLEFGQLNNQPSFLNQVICKLFDTLQWSRIRGHYYNPAESARLEQHGLEIWPGIAALCKKGQQNDLVIEMDVSSFRYRRTDTVLDVIKSIFTYNNNNNKDAFKEECLRQLLNEHVTSTWHQNRNFRLEDIVWRKTPETTFVDSSTKGGKKISLLQYYCDHFGVKIHDTKQPLLVTTCRLRRDNNKRRGGNNKKTVLLVPELCHLTHLSRQQRCDETLMRQLGQLTRLSPLQRDVQIRRFLELVTSTNETCRQILADWHVKLADQLIQVDGYLLKPERICTNDGGFFNEKDYKNGDFTHCIDAAQPLVGVPLRNWAIVYDRRWQHLADDLISRLIDHGRNVAKITVEPPQRYLIGSPTEMKPRTIDFIHAIRKIKAQQQQQQQIIVVVVLLPSRCDQNYIAVKQECNLAGLVSQCVTIHRLNDVCLIETICRRLFLQIQVKLGAELWGVPMPDMKLGGLMGVGLDVYHSPQRNQPSWVALVGSLNHTQTRYYNVTYKQSPREEAANGLSLAFTKLLLAYSQVNASLPKKIIVFRDGLGSDQLKMSKQFEIPQIREAFKSVDVNYQPEFLFIVCVKRIGVRVATGCTNPPPGTLIERVIGEANWYDFYLVSQSSRMGTATPCHYVVIEDTSRYSKLQIQRLVWKFAHLCYERAATARQPAPAVYADRFAYMVGHILKTQPNALLCDKLFYL